MIHGKTHSGEDSDVAKIRSEFWIKNVQRICKSINYKCVTCRKLQAKVATQVMGKLPEERLKSSLPW